MGDKYCQQCGQPLASNVTESSQQMPNASAVTDLRDKTPQEMLHLVATAAVEFLQPIIAREPGTKVYEIYLQPTEQYADSFLRVNHMKSNPFSKPDATTPITSIEIEIAIRPGVLNQGWASYGLDIRDPQTDPSIGLFTDWTEATKDDDLPINKLLVVGPHFLSLLKGRQTVNNEEPDRESPE
jgi:hypothetical protein